eukprot:7385078-Prymnesium_polylepis.1
MLEKTCGGRRSRTKWGCGAAEQKWGAGVGECGRWRGHRRGGADGWEAQGGAGRCGWCAHIPRLLHQIFVRLASLLALLLALLLARRLLGLRRRHGAPVRGGVRRRAATSQTCMWPHPRGERRPGGVQRN